LRGAGALGRRVAARAAWTEVHGRDEGEARREQRSPAHARDADDAVLQRLPERLERRPLELGQLVEEQHPAVRKARLARARATGAATDERGHGGAVVWRAEGRLGDERPLGREQTGH
jgi:hypothetical protein